MGLCNTKTYAETAKNDNKKAAEKVEAPPQVAESPKAASKKPHRTKQRREKFFVEDPERESVTSPRVKPVAKSTDVLDKLKEAVGSLPSFTNITEEQRDAVFEAMGQLEHKAGEVLCKEGQRGRYFSVICHGEFESIKEGDEARKLKSWDHFSERALMFEGGMSRTVKAVTDGSTYVLDRLTYQRILVKTATNVNTKNTGFLTQVPILAPLTEEQREQLADCLVPKTYSPGQFIVRQGERGDTFFFVESGEVAVVERSRGNNGEESENELKRRGKGWYFGEGALQSKEGIRNADVKAVSTTKCLALGREDFYELLGPLHTLINLNFKRRVLRTVELLSALSDEQLDEVVDLMESRTYAKDEYICKQGEAGDTFFIIKEGQVKVTRKDPPSADTKPSSPRDEEKEIGTLIPGDYFGEGALLTNDPRRANIIAVGEVTCIALSRDAFTKVLGPLQQVLGKNFDARKNSSKGGSDIEWDDIQKIKTIGSGSYGTVTIVRHRITGQTYALKRIRKATVVAKKQQKFIRNERNILWRVNHPFIVNLVRTFKDEDSVYMLTEICLGGELYTLMKETVDSAEYNEEDEVPGCFDMMTCKFYVGVVVLALEYLHGLGIIHRDLKPENLLLTKDGFLKLADFGFAKQIGNTRTYSLCGTPEYTAPEVYKRAGHGRGVDFWALGVLLYEMASGFSPFHVHSQNSWDCYVEISKYEKSYPNVQFPSLFSAELSDLLLRLLHPNPNKRIGSRRTAKEIKRHPFFSRFSWSSLVKMETKAPFIPPIDNLLDTSNFEECKDRHTGDNMQPVGTLDKSTMDWDRNF
eukprot:TRINITY_DN383_c1_g1_i3.p1 TRINITY_DN383_c1_g1~~TRINITY_DN383_c1_g1_i3.p1  ORF type:complete len:811 (-),score=267.69 TRINITY_DN383_c1_g1_i3:286-2718(-)